MIILYTIKKRSANFQFKNKYKRMHQQADVFKEEALARMEMSQQFTKFLKRGYEIFGDYEALICNLVPIIAKNMTPITFWFLIDALYFNIDENNDNGLQYLLKSLRQEQNFQFEEISDLQFILKLRKLVSNQKMGTLNLQDIKSTSIDQVIEIVENHLDQVHQQNMEKLEKCRQRQQNDKQNLSAQLDKFHIKFKHAHPMFYYEQLQADLKIKWAQEHRKQQNKDKCYLCSKTDKLITCNVQKCHLKVHPTCYPTFTHRFDSKATKPSQEELKKFVCENCVNNIDYQNQKCEICCCLGGHFVKVSQQDAFAKNRKAVVNKQNTYDDNKTMMLNLKIFDQAYDDQQQKPKHQIYVHLTCFIWNTDLKWSIQNSQVEGLHQKVKKKLHGMCSFCGISYGVTIPCSNDTCRRFYHGQCAKRHNLQMNLIRAKTSVIELFCQRHRHLKRYEALQQNEAIRFREVKKMFEGVDKEIKRLNVVSSYQQIKLIVERDYCSVCGKQEGRDKITICKQCRKWYHNRCSQSCKNCS